MFSIWKIWFDLATGRKGPFQRFQHLLQHAFNTLLNEMVGAFEQVVQHCWKRKNVESLWKVCWIKFKIGLNFHSTSIQLFLCSRNVEWPQICDNFLRNARTGDQNEMFCKGDFKTHCQGWQDVQIKEKGLNTLRFF